MSLINRITGVFTKSFRFWPAGQVPEVSIFLEVSSGSLGSKLSVLVRSLWSAMMTTLTLEKYHTLTACQGSPDKKRLNKSALRGKKRPSGAIKLQQAAIRWETPFHIQLSQQCPWPSLPLRSFSPFSLPLHPRTAQPSTGQKRDWGNTPKTFKVVILEWDKSYRWLSFL